MEQKTVTTSRLKKCPFCGEKPKDVERSKYHDNKFVISCDMCRIPIIIQSVKAAAIKFWNMRVK